MPRAQTGKAGALKSLLLRKFYCTIHLHLQDFAKLSQVKTTSSFAIERFEGLVDRHEVVLNEGTQDGVKL